VGSAGTEPAGCDMHHTAWMRHRNHPESGSDRTDHRDIHRPRHPLGGNTVKVRGGQASRDALRNLRSSPAVWGGPALTAGEAATHPD
jgi:hypothetical protein